MKTNNHWIKYFGIAFGLIIALGLISMIVNGGILVLSSLGLMQNNMLTQQSITKDFNQEYSEKIENMDINFNAGNLIVQSGDKFMVGGSGLSSGLKIQVENDTLVIEDQGNVNLFGNMFRKNKAPTLVITIPKDTILNRVDLEMGAGRGEINGISAKELNLTQGAGELVAANVQAQSGKLSGGAGAVSFTSVKLHNFDIESGVGLVEIQGQLTGDFKLDCGVGQTILNINGNSQDYFIDADQGLGPITVDGNKLSENGTGPKTAPNTLEVNGGVGAVEINFNPQT